MEKSDRRNFLKASATIASVTAIGTPAFSQGNASANDRIRIGLIGMGGRMRAHIRALAQMENQNVEIVAICDCDQSKLDSAMKNIPALKGKKLTTYSDMRAMYDDPSIDAVSIALGERWHALATIWACQAGKDVYVEKPGMDNLFEGRQMVAAARKYNRMVQHGTQNRSSPNIMEGIAKLREGAIGDVYMARGMDYKIRGNLGRVNPSETPAGLDWDQWLGPKAMRPYSQFWHKRWYWVLNLGLSCFGNQAVHEYDVLRWGLNLDSHPTEISTMGGNFVHEDDRTAPTHVAINFRFGDSGPIITYEHRSWYTNGEAGFGGKYPFVQPKFPVGTIFFGSEGHQIFPDYSSYHTFLGPDNEPGPSKSAEGHPMEDLPHFENWIAAIRAREHNLLNADIEEGYKSSAMPMLARASYQVGRSLRFDPKTETVIGDDEANRLLNEPTYRGQYVVPKQV